ncbi:chitin deacetylase [Thoreauomyces humboldtii]|nr:chitin deacetylase [Thoreauomyces humboldtii]
MMLMIRSMAALVVLSQLASAQVASATGATPTLNVPPPMPSSWPATDEKLMVTGDFLNDPLVTEALAYVNAVVPAAVLSIAPSKYVGPCVATYDSAAAVQNCYWPTNLCTRNNATANFQADITACPGANEWGLTYDDGPIINLVNGVSTDDSVTLRAKLKAYNKLATFFVVGSNGIQFPSEILDQHEAGHQLGVHTWSHYPATTLTNAQFVGEIKYTEAIIYNATGLIPTMWRPPCGDVDDRIRAIAAALGYRTVLWSTTPDRDDTAADQNTQTDAGAATILSTVKTWFTAQPGFISLSHDIDTWTTSIDMSVLDAVNAEGTAFPLQMQPVGTCMNLPFYRNGNATVAASSSSAVPTSTSVSSVIASSTSTVSVEATAPAAAPATGSSAGTAVDNKAGVKSAAQAVTARSFVVVASLAGLIASVAF